MAPLPAPDRAAQVPPVILIVEDDRNTLELYATALNLDGLWVAPVTDVATALQYADDLQPHAVVTDVMLNPGPDGIELARKLREMPATASIPIFAVTGRNLEDLGEDVRLFDKVLTKPVDIDVLIAELREAIALSQDLRRETEAARAGMHERGGVTDGPAGRMAAPSTVAPERQQVERNCPKCDAPLVWTEQRRITGVVFDYYRPCRRGCGLFCYDTTQQRFMTLID